ncbi:EamA family transporter [Chitinophaga japonensis]|uniref:Drug/metabolite transporter (DMT)-like permease n=1 Tax=Chitinophaga japonensis TaxID=104662 RepID=A0A562T716_CHIJA|nr:EamA family transporter [Chitinophaga japonensis]TWI89044.1 drug/metabolite transporter (DMT)-like permease [Chitinophaga japonensis]
MTSNNPPRWLVVLAFLAIYIVWGTTYLAIAVGLQGFPPFVLTAMRCVVAGLLLLAWCLARGEKLPGRGTIGNSAVSGILMLVGGTGLVSWAEQYVNSGYAAIIMATEPFFFVLLDKKQWSSYFSNKWVLLGLLIGFAGIVLFFHYTGEQRPEVSMDTTMVLTGNGVLLLGAILWVVGSLYARNKLDHSHSNTLTTGLQLLAAGLFSALTAAATGEWGRFSFAQVPAAAWGGFLYLVVMGSLVAYMAFTWLITIRPPALVSTHTYVNPVVAVLMGWAFAGEHISLLQVLALLVILLGVLFTNVPNYKLMKAV